MLCAATLAVLIAAALHAQSEEFGKWEPLANGKDLTGWTTAKFVESNNWTVEDGALYMPGAGRDICTQKEYESYELELEYKVPPRGNSGVYLRGVVEIQIGDTPGDKGKSSCGAIYSQFGPLAAAGKPAGEWNRFRILHIGPRISVWHNGELVQDNVYFDGKTNGSMGEFPLKSGRKLDGKKGPIMLQGDHGKVWYRNLRIRPLFAGDGWRPLWNGKDLSEFNARGDKRAEKGPLWAVQDHAFNNLSSGESGGHDIWTNDAFGNFLVHYAYKSDPKKEGGNSGFYLRDQWEIQILSLSSLTETHHDGSLYSIKCPDVLARTGPENWNHMDVKVDGMKIWVWQNGKLTHDGVTLKTRTDDHSKPTPAFTKAPFKFQGDHGKVFFTDLHIKPLPDSVAAK
jgi:hypothetical protein